MAPPPRGTAKPEIDLLCAILRPRPDAEQVLKILEDGIDFAVLLRAAADHGVRPPLIRSLATMSWRGVPSDVRASLEAFQRLHLARMLALAEELRRVAACFAEHKLPFAVFKGVTLSLALYGDLAAREYNDIDILVPQASVAEAERLLAELGYKATGGDAEFRRAFQSYQGQYAFGRDEPDTAVDLHWRFCGVHLPFPVTPDELWSRLGSVSVGDHSIPAVLGPDLALLLAGHGTKETWRSLNWVRDFAAMSSSYSDLDWAGLLRAAQRRRSGNALLLAGILAAELMQVAMPTALAAEAARNAEVRLRAGELIERLRRAEAPPPRSADFADFDLCDRRWERLTAVARLAVVRTAGDYRAMPLPRPLWGLYYVTRPFRLAAKSLGVS